MQNLTLTKTKLSKSHLKSLEIFRRDEIKGKKKRQTESKTEMNT